MRWLVVLVVMLALSGCAASPATSSGSSSSGHGAAPSSSGTLPAGFTAGPSVKKAPPVHLFANVTLTDVNGFATHGQNCFLLRGEDDYVLRGGNVTVTWTSTSELDKALSLDLQWSYASGSASSSYGPAPSPNTLNMGSANIASTTRVSVAVHASGAANNLPVQAEFILDIDGPTPTLTASECALVSV